MCARACARARARVRVRVRVPVRVRMRACVRICVCACACACGCVCVVPLFQPCSRNLDYSLWDYKICKENNNGHAAIFNVCNSQLINTKMQKKLVTIRYVCSHSVFIISGDFNHPESHRSCCVMFDLLWLVILFVDRTIDSSFRFFSSFTCTLGMALFFVVF